MLLLGTRLIGVPIMGLQTGTKLAETKMPIINPGNLKIVAYEVDGPLLSERPSIIRIADVREFSSVGMIIDSNDEFIGVKDVISIEKIYKLNFKLIGLNVIDESKRKIGRVSNFTVETDNFTIQQLNVSRGIMKSLTDTELLIHRSQIVEINDETVIVKTAAKKLAPINKTEKLTYMNPFRSIPPQTEGANN